MPAKDLLTDLKIKHLKPDPSRAYKKSDGAGLFLLVHPNGSKYWRFSYYWAQARQEIHLGQYPDIPLIRARVIHLRGLTPLMRRISSFKFFCSMRPPYSSPRASKRSSVK